MKTLFMSLLLLLSMNAYSEDKITFSCTGYAYPPNESNRNSYPLNFSFIYDKDSKKIANVTSLTSRTPLRESARCSVSDLDIECTHIYENINPALTFSLNRATLEFISFYDDGKTFLSDKGTGSCKIRTNKF